MTTHDPHALRLAEFYTFLHQEGGYRNIRMLDDQQHWAATFSFIYTRAIIVGRLWDRFSYEDRWCYPDEQTAVQALLEWDGRYIRPTSTSENYRGLILDCAGEPTGWHRHPTTGRRREDGQEWIAR